MITMLSLLTWQAAARVATEVTPAPVLQAELAEQEACYGRLQPNFADISAGQQAGGSEGADERAARLARLRDSMHAALRCACKLLLSKFGCMESTNMGACSQPGAEMVHGKILLTCRFSL